MPRAYSLDLRDRVVRFVEAGRSCHAAAAHFCVSVSFAVRLMRAFLIARIEEKAGITMPELPAELAAATGTKADPASLSRFLIRNGYRFKKNPAGKRARSPRYQSGTRRMDHHTPAAHAA